jgi:epsilon-lactone hydrolase
MQWSVGVRSEVEPEDRGRSLPVERRVRASAGRPAVDPALTPESLRRRAVDYVAAGDRKAELVSPIFVRLEVAPGVPHVFQGFAAMLDEGDAALTSAGEFVRAHLAG